MRAREFVIEETFIGSPCTKDCSGHKAGYEWSKRNNLASAVTKSPSFNKGAYIAKNYKERPQGGGKVKGQLSQSPSAIRRRDQRAATSQPTTPIAEATGDEHFDQMMRGITDPNALAAHDRDERVHMANHEFLQLGEHVWAHLEKLGRQMLKKPERLDWYVQKINSGDYAAISDWLTSVLRISPDVLEKLDHLCYKWGRPLDEFVESVEDGTFNQDYVQHWKQYKAHAEGND